MAGPATRSDSFVFHNGEKAKLPFSPAEYGNRLQGLRVIMAEHDLEEFELERKGEPPVKRFAEHFHR